MGDKLLIRAYNVEVGDCIYVRIPDGGDHFHILIDCGTKGKTALLKRALRHLERDLPDADQAGKKRLDLVIVSHEHADHIKGFDPAYFKNIEIRRLWLSAAMNPNHPQAKKTNSLHAFATERMRSLVRQGTALSPQLAELASLYEINNDGALEALRTTLPQANGIVPTYVDTKTRGSELGLSLVETKFFVLGPERDIDGYYLGKEASDDLRGFSDGAAAFNRHAQKGTNVQPGNISAGDFRRLRSRIASSSFAFAELASKVKNNASLVLLIEWRGRRLLFVGDAEWEPKFTEGRHNGGWNVMWKERKARLNQPIDFLKIGHHGSINSTPWNPKKDGEATEPSRILDAILPRPKGNAKPRAYSLVSTKRKDYKTIPDSALLVELGKRVRNTRRYMQAMKRKRVNVRELPQFADYEKAWLSAPQPLRTDHENTLTGADFVEVEIDGR